MPRINFLAIEHQSRSNNVSIQELENMFLEENPDGTKNKFIVRTRDGAAIHNPNIVSEFPNSNLALAGSVINGTTYGLFETAFDPVVGLVPTGQFQIENFMIDPFIFEGTLDNHVNPFGFNWTRHQSTFNASNIVVLSSGGILPSITNFGHNSVFYSITNAQNNFANGYTITLSGHKLNKTLASNLATSYWYAVSFKDINNWEGVRFQAGISTNTNVRVEYFRQTTTGINILGEATLTNIQGLENSQQIKISLSNADSRWVNITNGTGHFIVNIQVTDAANFINSNNFAIGTFPHPIPSAAHTDEVNCTITQVQTGLSTPVFAAGSLGFTRNLIVYDGTNSSNLYLGSVTDGQITNTKAVVKSQFHTTNEVVAFTHGTSNILLSGANVNFVTTEKDLSNLLYVTKPEFSNGTVGSVAFLGSVYYFNSGASDRIWASDLETPTSWPITKFARAEYAGDRIEGLLTFRDNLWVFGGRTTEIWYSTGNADFPASRLPNGIIPLGVIGKAYTATMNHIYVVGFHRGTPGVWRTVGYDIQKVSTPEVDRWLTNRFDYNLPYGRPFYLSNYQQEDHNFIVLNRLGGDFGTSPFVSPDASGRCYVYDEKTSTWHRRTTSVGSGSHSTGYPFTWFTSDSPGQATIGRYALAAGPTSNCVAEIRQGLTTDVIGKPGSSGNSTTSLFTKRLVSPHVTGEDKNLFHSKFRLDTDIQNTNSTVVLFSSENDGSSYSNLGIRQLKDKHFVEWHRLGYAEDRNYKLESDSNIKLDIVGAFLDVIPGYHSGGHRS